MTVNHIVVLNNIFARIKVIAFNSLLCRFQSFRHSPSSDWCVIINAQPVHQRRNSLTLENSHQIIFGRNIKLSLAWITLTSATTAQLIVNSA